MAYDVAWGYDLGDEVAHITTNISPGPKTNVDTAFSFDVDFFRASEIVGIEDVETKEVVFDLAQDQTVSTSR